MNWFLSGVAALCVLVLPGLALQAWIKEPQHSFWEWFADGIGLSIALTALLAELFFWLGISPGGWGLALFYGLCLLVLISAGLSGRLDRAGRADWPAGLGGAGLLGGLIAFRWVQASGLAFPNWVDSVHHSLIVRKMVEYGGIPPDLRPYLDAPFSYHYGFHLLAAIFSGLALLQPDQAVLWLGQAIGALVSLAIYRMGLALGFSRRAALLAGLLPGLVFYMPGYYLSWGRYPLLAGLVLFPLGAAAALELLRDPRRKGVALRLALLTAGLCLTHYLALLLFLFFLAILGLGALADALKRRDLRGLPWQAGAAVGLGGLAGLPWLARMLSQNQSSIQVGEAHLAVTGVDFNGLLSMLRPDYDLMLMGAAAFCLLLGLFRSETRRAALWGALLLFFAMPFAPQLGPFRADLFAIVLFLPAGLLLGWGVAGGAEGLAGLVCRGRPAPDRLRAWLGRGLYGAALLLLLGLGLSQTRSLINSGTVIADAADRRALEWVQANTPPEARFYINSTVWAWDVYRGLDGGYWLMPFTGRYSLVPPSVYTWMDAAQSAQVRDWALRSSQLSGCTPEFWEIVREADLGYVYVRQDKGSLQPANLGDCPRLRRVYDQDGIGIYEILKP